jgi:hypothetical protein
MHSPDRDGLGDLRNFGYRIPKGLPPPPTQEQKSKKAKHLALLVITIDDLPYEHIWKAWCQTLAANKKNNDDCFISLVCHAKYPKKVQSKWLRQRLLVHPPKLGRGNSFLDPEFLSYTPNWGSVDITHAMLDVLQNAMRIGHDNEKDMRFAASRYLVRRPTIPLDATEEEMKDFDKIPPVDQFLYVSETCIPVMTAQEVFDKVQDTTVSWVNARHRKDEGTPQNAYENDQFAGINRRIPGQFRWKADQWVLLCRDHASQIVDMDHPHNFPPKHQLWQSFRDINASDEMYFPTCLAVLGLLRIAADGEDTQRSRSFQQSGGGDERSRSNSNAEDQQGRSNSSVADEKSRGSESSSAQPVEQVVLKRPVTYTDWTEGMRNPATFVKGITDFKRVARLARDKGCLLARKFALYVAIPGMAPEDQKVTGEITVEEWKEEVEAMRVKDEEGKPPQVEEAEGVNESEEGEAPAEEEAEKESEEEGEEDEQEESFISKGAENEEEEEDDPEDEENQLE